MAAYLQKVPALDLVLDHGRHQVTRASLTTNSFRGKCRLWQILTELCKRYDDYYPVRDLRVAVWEDYPAEEGTVWGAVCEVRRKLLPLELTIVHEKGIGYRLEDLRKQSG